MGEPLAHLRLPPQQEALLRERSLLVARTKGKLPTGEVPTLDAASLQKLIRDNELLEEKKRQASVTTSEGSTSYAYHRAW